MTRHVVYPFIALALAGCSPSTAPAADDVVLIPAKSIYVSGETVSAQLFNRSEYQVGYGACSLQLEQLKGVSWVLIARHQTSCIDVLYVLAPSSSRVMQLLLDPMLPPGRYRLRQSILPQTRLPVRYIYSPDFSIGSAA